MTNKNDYMLLAKCVTNIVNNLDSAYGIVNDLTKNFNKGLDGEYFRKDALVKIGTDINAIKNNLNNKVLPELKKKSV